MKRIVFVILFFTFISLSHGAGLAPEKIGFELYRGESAENKFQIINTRPQKMNFQVETGEWLSAIPEKGELEPFETKKITLKAEVPDDVINGEYDSITKVIFSGSQKNIAINPVLGLKTKVRITGHQKVNTLASVKDIDNIEENQLLVITTKVSNHGNVRIKPEIEYQVFRNNYLVMANKKSLEEVMPGETKLIVAEEPNNLGVGNYTIDVSVLTSDKVVTEKTLVFSVVPYGSFSRDGDLKKLVLSNQDNQLLLTSEFHNKGVASEAVMVADIYRNGKFYTKVETPAELVLAGEKKALAHILPDAKAGKYTAKAKIVYSGKHTEYRTADIRLGSNPVAGVLVVLSVVLIGIVIVYAVDPHTVRRATGFGKL